MSKKKFDYISELSGKKTGKTTDYEKRKQENVNVFTETEISNPEKVDVNTESSLRLPSSNMSLIDQFKEKKSQKKRPTIEDTHQRMTFLVENELAERLNRLCLGKEKGFKTFVINQKIRELVEDLEKQEETPS